jgi:(p)ppGpp synthase/HD superfamily hydrolase
MGTGAVLSKLSKAKDLIDQPSLLDNALTFALHAHQGQTRRLAPIPYIVHPISVAFLLSEMNCGPKVIIAALLHDTVEDTQVTLTEIEQQFGHEIAELVGWVTEPAGTWEMRKLHLINKMRTAPLEAKLVAAADKYHNLHHLSLLAREGDQEIWSRFSRGAPQQAWFYRSLYASLCEGLDTIANIPLLLRLGELNHQLFHHIDAAAPPHCP